MKRALCLILLIASNRANAELVGPDVPRAYLQIAGEYAIPARIFYAVALTESARRVDGSREVRPWPWTLNIRGEAHYFARRVSAEQVLDQALASGEDLIDVGLMQVNWRYHRQRLRDPRAALDPYRNLRVAARILRECYRERAEWWDAVGCYHAPNNRARANGYRSRVRKHWLRLAAVG